MAHIGCNPRKRSGEGDGGQDAKRAASAPPAPPAPLATPAAPAAPAAPALAGVFAESLWDAVEDLPPDRRVAELGRLVAEAADSEAVFNAVKARIADFCSADSTDRPVIAEKIMGEAADYQMAKEQAYFLKTGKARAWQPPIDLTFLCPPTPTSPSFSPTSPTYSPTSPDPDAGPESKLAAY